MTPNWAWGNQGIGCDFTEAAGTGDRNDGRDVGEAGAVVERDFTAGDEQKGDGSQTAGKNGGGNVKTSQ